MQTKIIPIKKDWRNSLIRFIQWLMLCFVLLISCQKSYGQTDTSKVSQQQIDRFIDSVATKTTLKEFQSFLYEKITGKAFNETFMGFFNLFIQERWANRKNEKPK